MSIVPATLEDIPDLVSLVESCYLKDVSKSSGPLANQPKEVNSRISDKSAVMRDLLSKPGLQMLKYCSNGSLIASINIEKQDDILNVGMLLVRPDFQRGGIGRKMMAHVEELAKEYKCSAIKLDVLSQKTNIIEWYGKQGFKEIERIQRSPKWTGNSNATVELVVMIKEV